MQLTFLNHAKEKRKHQKRKKLSAVMEDNIFEFQVFFRVKSMFKIVGAAVKLQVICNSAR